MAKYYGSPTEFELYAMERAYDLPADIDFDDVTAALIVASVWLDGRMIGQLGSTLKTGGRAQERQWPRQGFVDGYGDAIGVNEVPREVEHATYEAAFRQLATPGALNVDFTLAKSYKSVSIDGAVSVTYAGASSADDAQLSIPIVDRILAPLLSSVQATAVSSMSGRLIRG